MVIEKDQSNEFYNCFEIGLTGNQEDFSKPKIFVIFTGALDSGHFRLLDPIKPRSPSLFKSGKYTKMPNIEKGKEILIKFVNNSYIQSNIETQPKSKSQPTHNNKDTSSKSEKNIYSDLFNMQCEICDQFCKGFNGLAIHKSKKHKTEQRQKIIKSEQNEINDQNVNDDRNIETTSELKLFWNRIKQELDNLIISDEFNAEKCDSVVVEFIFKLREIQKVLPGPKNPNTKYYEMRKNKNFVNVDRNYKQTTNPKSIKT